MSQDGEGNAVGEVEIIPRTESMSADDYRWHEQVAEFYSSLRAARVPMRQESTPVPGAKGEAEAIILALGSAGAFTAAVSAFKAFLSRERERTLELIVTVDGRRRRIMLRGDMNAETMERLTEEAMRRSAKE